MAKKTPSKTKRIQNKKRNARTSTKSKAPAKKNRSIPTVVKARKKVRKRDGAAFPALQKNLYSKIKQEYFDLDYIASLTPKEKRWLNKFMNEYLNANMNTTTKNLHRTKESRRQAFHSNNARNRDIYAIAKATGRVYDEEMPREESYDPTDDIIEMIDLKKQLRN